MLLFWLTGITVVIVSLLTEKPEEFRLIRTTIWTRDLDSQRPDEYKSVESKIDRITFTNTNEDAGKLKFNSSQMSLATHSLSNDRLSNEVEVKTNKSLLRKILLTWICGIEDQSPVSSSDQVYKNEIRISVKQTKFEKWILNINLVFIIFIAIGPFVVFSIT